MAPKRQAAARAGATSMPRRNPARNAESSSSVIDQMRVTKPRARSNTAKTTVGSSSKTRSSTRTQRLSYVGMETSDDELTAEEDTEDIDASPRASKTTTRRGSRTATAGAPRPTRTSLNDGSGSEGNRSKPKSATSNQGSVSRKARRQRAKNPLRKVGDCGSSDEQDEDGSGDDLSDAKATSKATPIKSGRRQPPLKKPDPEPDSTNSVIPDWLNPQIEHSTWVQIFQYAALSGDEQDTLDINWLLRTARVCRQFADPALTVLYKCPPIRDEIKAYGLVELLEKSPSLTAVNYRAKIEALHIDVRLVSLQGLTSPLKLMQNLPRLSEVLLIHGYDQAPYRLLKDSIKWTYPPELFQAFEVLPTANVEAADKTTITRLQAWQWSSRLMDKNWEASLARIKQVHQMPSFTSLRKVKFVNYQMPSIRLDKDPGSNPELQAEDERSVALLADSISVLESLEDVVFESSTIVGASLFSLLPAKLKRLELVNCAEVIADDLGMFLVTKGHQLESLVLHHNRSLNLGFLTVLGSACPHLKELRMNLQYFSLLETIDDTLPSYDTLLLPEQVPSWPTSLQLVHLENLRHWSSDAAEAFLQSFIDSAHNLPKLRHVSIKAMLNISWRSRSEFRRSWQEKFEKVFLRRSPDPKPHSTLRKPPTVETTSPLAVTKRRSKKPLAEPSRRSNRIVWHASSTSSRASSTSRGLRGQQRKPQSYLEPDSDEFDSDSDVDMEDDAQDSKEDDADQSTEGPAAYSPTSPGTFIQGMCTLVDINIDNQKPREHQYSMDDFLNDERDFESDGDWDGD
ncbi:hypothetical protein ColTof4_09422 [Colletotrichum tofieldiae]|uniref:Uncharacterized protein n=1 Tax=Colletotrichum tofieldiae TaxID=708197 RepID=A0A161Y9S7_9PEZI|nr:hypothetical protein CT0861_12236 [Colletotrichum tofieldiae]GKT57429.1 hypothetical protein ColTof3_04768 [Colletotrichum tofieldiae]GKT76999.1 hypothetical protein ColTof4_09422 [Colletotrichum tofieldiae]